MKNLFYFLISIISVNISAQVGVNTINPRNIFHIDGKSTVATTNPSSGAPTTAQASDDFIVTSTGSVGIGIINPIAKLELRPNAGTSSPGEGPIGIGETSLSASAAGAGALRYNTTSGGIVQYSNGTSWNTLNAQPVKSIVLGYFTTGQTLNFSGGIQSLATVETLDVNNDFASGIFTAPRTATYYVSANLLTTILKNWAAGEELSLTVGGIYSPYISSNVRTGNGGPIFGASIPLNAGDTITFSYYPQGGSANGVVHSSSFNQFSIIEL